MSSQALRDYINRHLGSTTVLAALGVVLDAQVTGTPLQPVLQGQIEEVLDAVGLGGMTEGVSAADLKQILAEIRFNMLLDAKFLFHPTRSLAWTHNESEILQAGGEVSAGFADALTHTIIPRLDGLSQQLISPEGSFLDVGVGVAGLSIAMVAPMVVAERGRNRSMGTSPDPRTRECPACRTHRPHPVAGTDDRRSFRQKRLRSRLASQRLHLGDGDSSGLWTSVPRVTSRWLAPVCDGSFRYRHSDWILRPTANGSVGWYSDGPYSSRGTLETDRIC